MKFKEWFKSNYPVTYQQAEEGDPVGRKVMMIAAVAFEAGKSLKS